MQNNFKLIYSKQFLEQLDMISLYIKNELNNDIAAYNLTLKIEKEIMNRLKSPLGFEKYKTNVGNEYYKIYINNYVVYYTVKDNLMEIRGILYNKRDFNKIL